MFAPRGGAEQDLTAQTFEPGPGDATFYRSTNSSHDPATPILTDVQLNSSANICPELGQV